MNSSVLSRIPARWVTVGAVFLTLLPLAALTLVAVTMSSDALRDETDRRVRVTADLAADYIDEQLRGLADLTQSYAKRPILLTALGGGDLSQIDRVAAVRQLSDLRSARSGISVAFVTGPDGRLLGIDPSTPQILGQDFSHRDWYRGVTAQDSTYISESYRSAAAGEPRVVAAASPVRAPGGETIAILVAAFAVEHIESFVEDFAGSQRVRLSVVDQSSARVAGSEIAAPVTLAGARAALSTGAAARVASADDETIAAAAMAPTTGWTVVAGIDRTEAERPVAALTSAVAGIASVLGVVLLAGVALLVGLLRGYKRNEGRLITAEAEAMDASRLKSEFLANMSHEIRTPLNGVVGMSELLAGTTLTPAQVEYVAALQHSAESLLGIINDILDLSKIEAGRLELEDAPFSPAVVVEEVAGLLAPRADEKGVETIVEIDPRIPDVVQGDGGRFRQVVTNLVSNAVKFTSAGEIVVHLSGTVSNGAIKLRVEVRDTGVGIPEELLDSVFGSFIQADASTTRRFGGSGLGLAIAKQLAEAMGGEIGADSKPGAGSTFWFTIAATPTGQAAPKRRPTLQGVSALIVDDNATNRRVLEESLRAWGVEPTVAEGPREALRIIGDAARVGSVFELALLDFHMPDMDGVQLARTIRADPRYDSMALVLLTSSAQRGELKSARDAGIRTRLTKPVRQSVLYDRLAEALADSAVSAPGPVARPQPTPVQPGPANTFQPTVLVVEDNEINRQVAVGMLGVLGYDSVVAAHGAEAVEMMRRRSFDAVLMDCQMPIMDGFEATMAVRAIEGDRHTPIIALTASALKRDEEKCFAAGMDGYVTKPLTSAKLRSALAPWTAVTPEKPGVEGVDDILDRTMIDELLQLAEASGGMEKLVQLVDTFVTSSNERIDGLEEAIASNNVNEIGNIAHSLRGSSLNFGATRVALIAEELEHLGSEGRAEGTADRVARLRSEMLIATTELNAVLARR